MRSDICGDYYVLRAVACGYSYKFIAFPLTAQVAVSTASCKRILDRAGLVKEAEIGKTKVRKSFTCPCLKRMTVCKIMTSMCPLCNGIHACYCGVLPIGLECRRLHNVFIAFAYFGHHRCFSNTGIRINFISF